jgi:GxxExxY protein
MGPAQVDGREAGMDQRDPETFAILGAAMEVRRQLGCGFLEAIYRNALRIEFGLRNIPFASEPELLVHYKTRLVGRFRPDFLCHTDVIVEVKALPSLAGADVAQTLNYLRVSTASRALLLNFGPRALDFKRLAGPNWARGAPNSL